MMQTPHVAVLPSPGIGHFIPMFELAKRLVLQHNVSATLIIPDSRLYRNEQMAFLEALPGGMNYILLPVPNFDDSEPEVVIMASSIARSLSPLRNVVGSLASTTNLVALVVDFMGTPAFNVANEFNISPYMLFPSNAMTLSLILYLPTLDATVSCEYRDLPEPVQIPGCIPLQGKDLLDILQDRQNIGYQWYVNEVKRYRMAEGIIVNTFSDIEAETIKALQEKEFQYPPIYPVGPLLRIADSINTEGGEDSKYILKWLDDQPPATILFICFGSLGLLSHDQITELAYGIEMSEQGFIWVVRSPKDFQNDTPDGDPLHFLPKGFVERTKDRGLLVSNWAPQVKILSHGSTGGFLTHCGWNSILESIVSNVPMIAWPLQAEQHMNAAMLCEYLKIALRLEANGEDGLVGRVEIASTVKNLMEGEKGRKIRIKTRDLKDAAAKVMSEDGSSTKAMADLVCQWKKKVPA